MRFLPVLLAAALSFAPQPAAAQGPASQIDYSRDATWLCLPGRKDICAVPLATTELPASGYGASSRSTPAAEPPIDCFYAYPTVSRDGGMNSDLVPSDSEERYAAQNQLSRFAAVCKPYAPLYRSMTVGAVAAAAAGADVTAPAVLAYGDVRAAWKEYLARFNHGRPFVLIGHSQGSLMLQRLIQHEIEGKPEAKRMRLAIIPGFNVMVPEGKLVGGTFKTIPLCSRDGQSGCVMSWVSYRERNVPPPGALFGYADQPGMTVGCVNPARPGATGWTSLDSYWNARSSLPVPGGPIRWSSQGASPTPLVHTEGLVSARCVNEGPRGYLSLRTNPSPGGKRTDRIGGEVGVLGFFLPGWGMHLADLAAPQGDLIRLVDSVGRH